MRRLSLEDCYRLLELPESADAEEIRAAFRRLAKQYHPDVNPGRCGYRRFNEITEAYRLLREKLRIEPRDGRWGPCPQCGQLARILVGLDGRRACSACLLGQTQRRHLLPMPIITVVKHLTTLSLYGVGCFFFYLHIRTQKMHYAGISLALIFLGLIVLAIEVLWFIRRETRAARPYIRRSANQQHLDRQGEPFASKTLPREATDGQSLPSADE